MRDRSAPFLLSLTLSMLVALAIVFVERETLVPRVRPRDLRGLARWLGDHPTDWQAAAAITEGALDTASPSRFTLWRLSWRFAHKLAPWRPQSLSAFVQSGFFHWYELPERDRREILAAATPLLRDPDEFFVIHNPVWQLTGDMAFLRRANPGTAAALITLRDLAVMNGLFADYRELREEARKSRFDELAAEFSTLSPAEIIQRLPQDFDQRDEPLIKAALEELRRRPLDMNPDRGDTLDRLIGYAIRHDLPLEGLERVASEPEWTNEIARARLEATLRGLPDPGPPTTDWTGLCGSDICGAASRSIRLDDPATVSLPIQVVQTDEVWPYVELLVDDVPVTATEVHGQAELRVPIEDTNTHQIEIRLLNPLTRNLLRRRVRIR